MAAIDMFGGVLDSMLNYLSVDNTNTTNDQIARRNMAWQTQENQKQRAFDVEQWEREMAYNSPFAQRERYRDAGLNPFLTDSTKIDSGKTSAPSAPPLTSPPASIPAIAPRFTPFSDIYSLANLGAQSANQSAQMFDSVMNAVSVALKDGNTDLAYQILDYGLPMIEGANFDSSQFKDQIAYANESVRLQNENQAFVNGLQRKYGDRQADLELKLLSSEYDNFVSQSKLNDKIRELYDVQIELDKAKTEVERQKLEVQKSEITRNLAAAVDSYASAVAHKAQGRLSNSEASIKEDAKTYLVSQAKQTALQMEYETSDREAEWFGNTKVRSLKRTNGYQNKRATILQFGNDPATYRVGQFTGTLGNLISGSASLSVK